MKVTAHRSRPAFTLIELLVVIAIIAILAAMLLPVITIVKTRVKMAKAKTEMIQILQAIESYHNKYSRYPASSNAVYWALNTGVPTLKQDFTQGDGTFNSPGIPVHLNNAEVIAILMDMEHYPNGTATLISAILRTPSNWCC